MQAVRLVKHSIMQVESMEADLDEEEGMFEDLDGVAEAVNRFNNRNQDPDDRGQPDGGPSNDDDGALPQAVWSPQACRLAAAIADAGHSTLSHLHRFPA